MGFFHITRLSRYNLQYEEDIIKGIRVERNKWKLATINVSIEQNESILKELGVDLEEIKERVKKQTRKGNKDGTYMKKEAKIDKEELARQLYWSYQGRALYQKELKILGGKPDLEVMKKLGIKERDENKTESGYSTNKERSRNGYRERLDAVNVRIGLREKKLLELGVNGGEIKEIEEKAIKGFKEQDSKRTPFRKKKQKFFKQKTQRQRG